MMRLKSLLRRVSSSSSNNPSYYPTEPKTSEFILVSSQNEKLKEENQNLRWENYMLNSKLSEIRRQIEAFETLVECNEIDPIVHKLLQNLQKITPCLEEHSLSSSSYQDLTASSPPKRVTWSLEEPKYHGESSNDPAAASSTEEISITRSRTITSDAMDTGHITSCETTTLLENSSIKNEGDTTKDTRKYFQAKIFELIKKEQEEKREEPNMRAKLRPRSNFDKTSRRKLRPRDNNHNGTTTTRNPKGSKTSFLSMTIKRSHERRGGKGSRGPYNVQSKRKSTNVQFMADSVHKSISSSPVKLLSTPPSPSKTSTNPTVRLLKCSAADDAQDSITRTRRSITFEQPSSDRGRVSSSPSKVLPSSPRKNSSHDHHQLGKSS